MCFIRLKIQNICSINFYEKRLWVEWNYSEQTGFCFDYAVVWFSPRVYENSIKLNYCKCVRDVN